MQKVRCYFIKRQLLVSIKFQDFSIFYFTKYLFHLSLTVLYTLSIIKNFRLEDGTPLFKQHVTCAILLKSFWTFSFYRATNYLTYMFPSLANKIK